MIAVFYVQSFTIQSFSLFLILSVPSSPSLCHLARCECHGHADHCDTSVTPYRCLCLPETHTEGNYVSNKHVITKISAFKPMCDVNTV